MDGLGSGWGFVVLEYYLFNYKLGKILGIGLFGKVKVVEYFFIGYKVVIKIFNW